jgi:radical SAM superfamily enzyme with C-terminal helix-hairpin-helix motif
MFVGSTAGAVFCCAREVLVMSYIKWWRNFKEYIGKVKYVIKLEKWKKKVKEEIDKTILEYI